MISRPARSVTAAILMAVTAVLCLNSAVAQAPRARPVAPAPATPPAGGSLRNDPEESQLKYANYVYGQRQWTLAADQYRAFLKKFPNSKSAASAWYRLGECHLKVDRATDAEQAYLRVMRTHKDSEYAAPAAYRLASLYYARNMYKTANPYFEIARTRSKKQAIQLSAGYYRARCLKELGMVKETIAAYENVAKIKKGNPYLESSLLEIARMQATSGDESAALKSFTTLAAESTNADLRAEALVKAGLIHSTQGNEVEAKKLLEEAMDLRTGGKEWKPDAQFHLIQTYYKEKDYAKVTSIYRKGAFAMADDVRPKMLLMVGNAYRHQNQHREAIDTYLILREHYPASKEASESEYRKLLCFFNMKNTNLPEFADDYVDWQSRRDASSKNIDMAHLLKAEHLFTNGVYGPAGRAYDRLRIANVPEELRASALYKRGWAHNEGGNHPQAVRAFSAFLDDYRDDARASTALAKRALSFRSVEDYTSAVRDLKEIIEKYPESEAVELAYQQTALIKGQQRDHKGMIAAYQVLLEKYPDSKAMPEAHFWIGWGKFEEKQFAESAQSLRKARDLDGKAYRERATLRIILSEYSLENVAAVKEELDLLAGTGSGISIPPQVYLWLGLKLFDSSDYAGADKYLSKASNSADPGSTQAVVWKHLGQARLYNGSFNDATKAFDNYLKTSQPPTSRARVMHDKAAAMLAMEMHDKAEDIVEEALSLRPQSRVYGQLCLLWGEIALQQEDYERAIQRLVKPTYAIEDGEITPPALLKSALAHEKLGQKEKAAELRTRLKSKFPGYEAGSGAIRGLPNETAMVSGE